MTKESYTDKLAKYILIASLLVIVGAIAWYFSNVLIYMIAAGVISLIASPLMGLLRKVKIKNYRIPDWFSAIISMVLIVGILLFAVTQLFPVVGKMLMEFSSIDMGEITKSAGVFMKNINNSLIATFPTLGADFKLENLLFIELAKVFDVSIFTNITSSIAGFVVDFGVAVFSIAFISFFFIKDSKLFPNIIVAAIPEKYEQRARAAISEIESLLSRYFAGIVLEIAEVTLLNFLGLWLIAKLDVVNAIGIAFFTGVLNIIPYVGPLSGTILGTIMAVVMRYNVIGNQLNFFGYGAVVLGILCVTQIIDIFIYQPIIYSKSIRANALEIFIVILMAGTIGGPVGMLVAIPAYTAIRVIASRFLGQFKGVKLLTEQKGQKTTEEKIE